MSETGEFYIQWHITDACNLRCKHCYQGQYTRNNELSISELLKIGQKLNDTLAIWERGGRIALTGGEPFIRKDFPTLATALEKQPQVKLIGILTNGTMIRKNIDFLNSLEKLHYIQLSIEGAQKTNDAIRGNGTYKKVIESTDLMHDNNIPVRWMVTLHKNNVQDVPMLISLAEQHKVDALLFERFVPMGNGSELSMLTNSQLKETYQYIMKYSDQEKSDLAILKLRTLWILCDTQRANVSGLPLKHELGASCSVGFESICILPDATVLPCRRLPIPIGNLKTDSLFKIWYTSKVLWDIRNKKNLKGKCNNCEYIPRCGGCRATAYALTGDYLAEDPQCWRE